KVRVVKIGGNALERPEWLAACADALRPLEPVVVVHGGGRAVSTLSRRLDLPVEKQDGLRVTTPAVAEAVEMVLAGPANRLVVAALRAAGLDAIGLSGVDGGLLTARPRCGRRRDAHRARRRDGRHDGEAARRGRGAPRRRARRPHRGRPYARASFRRHPRPRRRSPAGVTSTTAAEQSAPRAASALL